MTSASRIILSNRQENLNALSDFIHRWGKVHSIPAKRQQTLGEVAGLIFRHLATYAYSPGEPGSIVISLEERGPRLRLMFEDDAPAHSPVDLTITGSAANPGCPAGGAALMDLQHLAESLIYYHTADRKNRLVVFLG
jgi:hypothetical protein